MTFPIQKTDEEWRALLAQKGAEPGAFDITRRAHTERPFTGKYEEVWADGSYHCVCCGNHLFDAGTKFDSGCGWPSFTKPIEPAHVAELRDTTHGMLRVEVRSTHGDSHLGHVFPDGPRDRGGLRYCINSASLRFVHRDDMQAEGYGDYIDQVEVVK
jgi:peptide-methionine (R)-S-oxide reductase